MLFTPPLLKRSELDFHVAVALIPGLKKAGKN
jgi:hypothetical protein